MEKSLIDALLRVVQQPAPVRLRPGKTLAAFARDYNLGRARGAQLEFSAADQQQIRGLLQARAGIVDRQQIGQQRLLRVVPVGLAKWLAGFQLPGIHQRHTPCRVEITDDLDLYAADQRTRPRIDLEQQRVVLLAQGNAWREIALGGQQLLHVALHPSLECHLCRCIGNFVQIQVALQQLAHIFRRLHFRQRRRGGQAEQQDDEGEWFVHGLIRCRSG